jgi:predicted component of type VI protein secretion system
MDIGQDIFETKTDPGATEWRIDDDVVRLREWGTEIIHRLPQAPWDSAVIGTAESCSLQVVDPTGFTSREHARLDRGPTGWLVRDLASKNGTRVDGSRRDEVRLEPGIELGIGNLTLLAESLRFIALRSFIARLLGWTADKTAMVDFALRAIRLAATRRAPLVLCGPGDLISVAHAIHRHALGRAKPFVVSDPRRRESEESVRSAVNFETGLAAMWRARGGSLCMWTRRLPRDFADVRLALRDPATRVQLIVCAESRRHKPHHVEPIVVPPLSRRPQEIPRIIHEYSDEAAAAVSAAVHLTAADRDWILRNSSASISEIEKGTRRLLAIRNHDDNTAAAARSLGMAPISLARWIGRRALPERRPIQVPTTPTRTRR